MLRLKKKLFLVASIGMSLVMGSIAHAVTLDMTQYTNVYDIDFSKYSSSSAFLTANPTWSLWDKQKNCNYTGGTSYWWTGQAKYGVFLGMNANQGGTACSSGFQQNPVSATAGNGYGLYTYTGYMGIANQGWGMCWLLWPSDNKWPGIPGSIYKTTELDALESWSSDNATGQSTWHYYDPSQPNNNGQEFHSYKPAGGLLISHTYAVDWEKNSISLYVDGVQYVNEVGGTHMALDAADGGVNKTNGALVATTTGPAAMYIQHLAYYTKNSGTVTPVNAITLSAPVGLTANVPATLTGVDNYAMSATVSLKVDNVATNVNPTFSGTAFSINYTPATAGSHTYQVVDNSIAASSTITATVAAAHSLAITAPSGLVSGTAGTLSGTDNYTIGKTVSLIIDGSTTSVAPTISGTGFTVPLPATLPAGSHSFQIVDGNQGTSNTVTAMVAGAVINSINLAVPTTLVNGTAGTLSASDNYTPAASVTLKIDGVSSTVATTAVANGFTVPTPSNLTVATHTFQIVDGSVSSNTVSAKISGVAPSGSVAPISPLVVGVQNIPVSLNSSVTSAAVDWRTSGTPLIGDSDNVAVVGIGTSSPYAPNVTIDQAGVSSTLWLSVNSGPFLAQWSAVPKAALVPALVLTSPSGLIAGTPGVLSGTDNYALPASVTLLINGVTSTVKPSISGQTFSIAIPATLYGGTTTFQVVDGSTASSNVVTTNVAIPNSITLTAPTNLTNSAAGVLSGTDNYAIGNPVSLIIDGATTTTVTPTISGSSFTVPTPSGLSLGSHTFQVVDGSVSSTVVTATVSISPTISINAPVGLSAGTAGNLSGTENYTFSGSLTLLIDGATSTVVPTVNGTSFTVPLPATINGGAHNFQILDGSTASSNIVSATVSGTITATINLATPTNLVAGTAGVLSGTDNYTIGSPVTFYLDGNPSNVTPTVSGSSFTVPVPALTSGSHAMYIKDGTSATSNVVSPTVTAAPAVGSMPAPTYYVKGYVLGGPQNFPVTLNASVTSAVADYTTGTPVLGASDNVNVSGIGSAYPYVTATPPGTNASASMWLSINGGPFSKQWTAYAYGKSATMNMNAVSGLQTATAGTVSATTNYTPASLSSLILGVDGHQTKVTGTMSGFQLTVPTPSTLTAGTHSFQIFDNGKTFGSPVNGAVAGVQNITIYPPMNLVANSGGTLSGLDSYTLSNSLTLQIDGVSTLVTPTVSGSNFSVALPSNIVAGSHVFQIIDGTNATSNQVTATVSAIYVAPKGSVPQPPVILTGNQDFPVTLSSSVISAVADLRLTTGGTPVLGDPDNVQVTGLPASPIAAAVQVPPGGSTVMWLSINGSPFVAQWTATPIPSSAAQNITIVPPLSLVTGTQGVLSGNYSGIGNYTIATTVTLSIDGSIGTPVSTTANAGSFTVPLPAGLTVGSHSFQILDNQTASNVVYASVAAAFSPVLTIYPPTGLLTGQIGSLNGSSNYPISATITLRTDGIASTVTPAVVGSYFSVSLPKILSSGTHTFQIIDTPNNATSQIISVAVSTPGLTNPFLSSALDPSNTVNGVSLGSIQQIISRLANSQIFATYTIATLPQGCIPGTQAYVTDAQNYSDANGSPTGAVEWCNATSNWINAGGLTQSSAYTPNASTSALSNPKTLPTSAVGLVSGTYWLNNGVLSVAP